MKHKLYRSCVGELCKLCGEPATHKISEEIMDDDEIPCRHPYTQYICCKHFAYIMGNAAIENCFGRAE